MEYMHIEAMKPENPGSDIPVPNIKDKLLSQQEVDQLLKISELLKEEKESNLIDEIKDAILDSGKLSLPDWRRLRKRLKEIERLIPHIDLIIELKSKVPDQES
jgi:hypothetical protein